jgi:putative Mn2+ efflux pump MntP
MEMAESLLLASSSASHDAFAAALGLGVVGFAVSRLPFCRFPVIGP